VLDADITISPGEEEENTPGGEEHIPAGEERPPGGKESTTARQSARLALAGTYRPPLVGRLGAGLDQIVLHRVATAPMRALLDSVAEAITSPAAVGQTAETTRPGVRPVLETGMP
jgi:hypothetical protein